ncbi:MAG: hypothetical protein HC927_00015 [Deltaproteobacteria bacterium]|nr:hypothetical protein [Deltaproteobacteria bacterium]
MEKLKVDGVTFELVHDSIISATWTGELTEAAVRTLHEYTLMVTERLGPEGIVKALVDARAATGIAREARKQLTELGRDKHWDRVAFVGVSFPVKVLLELLAKALRLMKIEGSEVVFVDTPEHGLAWLLEHD